MDTGLWKTSFAFYNKNESAAVVLKCKYILRSMRINWFNFVLKFSDSEGKQWQQTQQ